ncbi:MAG: glycosyltransferase family 9 protein [Endomicrobiaceae bacterium]
MDKIIFFHMNQLGDLLFSLPVVKAARKQYPDIKIYSVVRSNLAGLLKSTGLVDKIYIKEKSAAKRIGLIKEIRKENIGTAVLFSESPESLISVFLSNIKKRVGFRTAGLKILLTDKAVKTGVPSLSNNIALAKTAGISNIQNNYTDIIKINSEAELAVLKWLQENNMSGKKFTVISPGASTRRREKCLQKNVWIETVNKLHDKNINIIIVGAKWEKKNIADIADKSRIKTHIFCPDGGLLELASLLSKAEYFIGIDSGTMHLAASLGIRCIALYGKTDPGQIGPQPAGKHAIIKRNSAKDITSEEIIDTFKKMGSKNEVCEL